MMRPLHALESRRFTAAAAILLAAMANLAPADGAAAPLRPLSWSELPAIPVPGGLKGALVGVSGDALIVAGGREGNETYSDRIFVLASPQSEWNEAELRWPRPLADGVSLAWHDAMICLGGKDDGQCYDDVFMLRSHMGKLARDDLPPLPEPAADFCGAVLGDTIYVAGGRGAELSATRRFWSLDLAKPAGQRAWQHEQPWPGPPRAHAVAAAQGGQFLLIGGRSEENALTDAYGFAPGKGWRRLADLPRPLNGVAAGFALGHAHVLVVDGLELSSDAADIKGALAYHTVTNTWTDWGTASDSEEIASLQSSVWWRGRVVVPVGGRIVWAQPRRAKARLGMLDYVMLGVYLAVLVGMGVYFSRRERTTDDFFLGGRRVPWWAAGISIFGTSISALTFMAIPAQVYRTDWVYCLGNLMIVAVAPFIIWFYLPFYRRLNVTSAYEYLQLRFNLSVRLLGSSAFMLFQLGRIGVVLYLPALALSAVTGMDVYVCILLMGVMATLYTTLGGIEAVIWTDVLQVAILLGGAVICFAMIAGKVPGGLAGIVSLAMAEDKLHAVNLTWSAASTGLWVVVVGNFLKYLIPYSSDQTLIQRYLTTSDERQAARSIWTNALLSLPVTILFFALGTALWAFYKTHPERLDPTSLVPDEILPWFVVDQMPPGLAGLIFAALFAAAMSSLDSSINSMATTLTTDFYQTYRPRASDDDRLGLARWATVLFGILGTGFALYMAWLETTSVWDRFLEIMGLLGGGLGGLFAAGIFTRRTSSRGILFGFAASALVLALAKWSGEVHFFLFGGIGLVSCLVFGWLASWFMPERGKSLDGLTVHSMNKTHVT